MGPMGFIMRKLGQEAMDELDEETAEGCAKDMKEGDVDDALKFMLDVEFTDMGCKMTISK